MDNTTFAVLNGKKCYPLERMLRALATAEGSYVCAVFDCCREKMPSSAFRGSGQADGAAELDDDTGINLLGAPAETQENIIMTFGCRPSAGVPAKSTIARTYFRYLRKAAILQNGEFQLQLPGCLNFFQNTDGKCEHAIKTAQPCIVKWTDHSTKHGGVDAFATQGKFFNPRSALSGFQQSESVDDAEDEPVVPTELPILQTGFSQDTTSPDRADQYSDGEQEEVDHEAEM